MVAALILPRKEKSRVVRQRECSANELNPLKGPLPATPILVVLWVRPKPQEPR